MFATLFRLISYLILAGGLIIAIADATRSVAADTLQMTRLGDVTTAYFPALAEKMDHAKTELSAMEFSNWRLSNVIDYLNAIPVALLAAAIFVLIYGFASRNREPRHF